MALVELTPKTENEGKQTNKKYKYIHSLKLIIMTRVKEEYILNKFDFAFCFMSSMCNCGYYSLVVFLY
jgi:hypothetical protein